MYIEAVAEEASEIVESDRAVGDHFKKMWSVIGPIMQDIIKKRGKDLKKELQPVLIPLTYYLRDFLAVLRKEYRSFLIQDLEKALFQGGSEQDVFEFTNTLLSLLIYEGYSLESLFNIVKEILIHQKNGVISLKDNFDFSKVFITGSQKEYEVILRMHGFNNPQSRIGDIEFDKTFDIESADDDARKFLSPGQNVLFGKVKVLAQDERAAGTEAARSLDQILDLVRFELEKDVIAVGQEYVVVMPDSRKARRFLIPRANSEPHKRSGFG